VVATRDLAAGTPVARFEGPVVAWQDVPDEEVIYVISFEPGSWLIPKSDARYLNHSCAPNCRFLPDGGVVTLRPVREGDELSIPYDWADREAVARNPEHYFWDPRWTFECRCGEPVCRGVIDRYRPE
jgi:hypothetical protein